MKKIIIDVREPDEYNFQHLEGAINIPLGELMSRDSELKDIAKDTEIILYCRSGSRAEIAKDILSNYGYTNILNGINQDNVALTLTK